MKKLIFLSAVISIGFLSCEKEQNASLIKASKNTENVNKSLNCAPWEDVTSLEAAAVDLNEVGVCNTSTCSSGTATYITRTGIVQNSAGTAPLYFSYLSPPTSVSIATQNYMWSNALSQAIAAVGLAIPPGYNVSGLYNFRVEVYSVPFQVNKLVMKFDISYVKCT